MKIHVHPCVKVDKTYRIFSIHYRFHDSSLLEACLNLCFPGWQSWAQVMNYPPDNCLQYAVAVPTDTYLFSLKKKHGENHIVVLTNNAFDLSGLNQMDTHPEGWIPAPSFHGITATENQYIFLVPKETIFDNYVDNLETVENSFQTQRSKSVDNNPFYFDLKQQARRGIDVLTGETQASQARDGGLKFL